MHTKGYLEDVSFISSKMFAKFLLINLLIILDIIFSCLFTYSEESHLVFAGSVLYRHTESEMLFKLASDLGKFFSVSILTYYLLIGYLETTFSIIHVPYQHKIIIPVLK